MIDRERGELYKTIWNIANKLRGAVEGWDFKNYVLGFLFYRYISEDFENYMHQEVNDEDLKYSELNDDDEWIQNIREDFIERKGIFIYPSHLFSRMLQRSRDDCENLNEELNKAFTEIELSTRNSSSSGDFEGLFGMMNLSDVRLGDQARDRNLKIREIMEEISTLNLKTNESDMFGDAYEYLIRMYASSAGKSGGEFYTPPEVSELLVSLVSKRESSKEIRLVYDPTCGSGSLLLKFQKLFPNNKDIKFHGQEINRTTYNLCRMNMFLHNVGYERFEIKCADTLKYDQFPDEKYDAIVSNPPYSIKWDSLGMENDPRFSPFGALAPNSKADWAFIQHSFYHLKNDAIAAIVCFKGIFSRDNRRERTIRKYLVENNYIDAIIQLPEDLFFGTTIQTCILVLKKSKQDPRILFINAENYLKKAPKRNLLLTKEVEQLYDDALNGKEKEYISRMVSIQEVIEKNFNLAVDTHIGKKPEEPIDINVLNQSIEDKRKKINEMLDEINALAKLLS